MDLRAKFFLNSIFNIHGSEKLEISTHSLYEAELEERAGVWVIYCAVES